MITSQWLDLPIFRTEHIFHGPKVFVRSRFDCAPLYKKFNVVHTLGTRNSNTVLSRYNSANVREVVTFGSVLPFFTLETFFCDFLFAFLNVNPLLKTGSL